jgi:hypothetical protein
MVAKVCRTASDNQNGQHPCAQRCCCPGDVHRHLIGRPETGNRAANKWQWTGSGWSNGHEAEGCLQQAPPIQQEQTKLPVKLSCKEGHGNSNKPDTYARAVASVECSSYDILRLARVYPDFEESSLERCGCGGAESNEQAGNGVLHDVVCDVPKGKHPV